MWAILATLLQILTRMLTWMKLVATETTMKIGPAESGTPLAASPTVGAKCRGGFTDISQRWVKDLWVKAAMAFRRDWAQAR